MKKNIFWRISLICFAVCAGLIGLFYLLADFGKALSKQCGLIQLVGAIILCVVIFTQKGRAPKLYGGIVLAITLGQTVALFKLGSVERGKTVDVWVRS